jgi:hypothetical protein
LVGASVTGSPSGSTFAGSAVVCGPETTSTKYHGSSGGSAVAGGGWVRAEAATWAAHAA